MKNKRGQAALEFLMTYGWAILVVLVAIGALAYFGVLSPEKLLPEKCIIATGSGLFCEQHSASVAGSKVTLRIKNLLDKTVNIDKISILPTCGTETTPNREITADNYSDIDVTCTGLKAGKVKGDIAITFKVEGFTKPASGQIVTTAA